MLYHAEIPYAEIMADKTIRSCPKRGEFVTLCRDNPRILMKMLKFSLTDCNGFADSGDKP